MALEKLEIHLSTGEKIIVTPNLGDTLAFESALRKNKQWGELKDNALKMNPYRGWNCARRLGLITMSWDEFTTGPNAAQSVIVHDPEESEADDTEDEEGSLVVPGVGLDTPQDQLPTYLPPSL